MTGMATCLSGGLFHKRSFMKCMWEDSRKMKAHKWVPITEGPIWDLFKRFLISRNLVLPLSNYCRFSSLTNRMHRQVWSIIGDTAQYLFSLPTRDTILHLIQQRSLMNSE